nr:hypothetical protein [Gimesia benthica]
MWGTTVDQKLKLTNHLAIISNRQPLKCGIDVLQIIGRGNRSLFVIDVLTQEMHRSIAENKMRPTNMITAESSHIVLGSRQRIDSVIRQPSTAIPFPLRA